jgi:hypothetical protein
VNQNNVSGIECHMKKMIAFNGALYDGAIEAIVQTVPIAQPLRSVQTVRFGRI